MNLYTRQCLLNCRIILDVLYKHQGGDQMDVKPRQFYDTHGENTAPELGQKPNADDLCFLYRFR
jgi:hypothetical protein